MKNNIFERQSTSKTFFKFAVPSVIGLLIVSMQMMIDGVFVGRYVGPSGLAAVNISQPYLQLIMSIAMMIALGGGVISAIQLGRKDKKGASETAFFTLLIKVVTLSIISLVTVVYIDSIVRILGADESLFVMVKSYLLPMASLAVFYNLIIYTETFVRIGGRPNAVFLSGLSACIFNIALDYLFVAKFGFGITGAAIATVMANFLGALALTPYLFNGRCDIQVTRPKGSKKLLKDILYNGSSEMLTVVSAAAATFLFNRIIMSHLGEVGISALTIVFYANGIVNITLFGLSQALQPIVSYNLGAKRVDRIYEVIKISLITGAAIGGIAFIGMKSFSLPLINLFTKGDIELTNLAVEATSYFVFAYVLSFVNIIASSFHTAIEKPMESAGIALLRSLIFVSIFLMIMPNLMGAKGIWMAVPLAELTCLFISVFLMKSSYKKIKEDSKEGIQVA